MFSKPRWQLHLSGRETFWEHKKAGLGRTRGDKSNNANSDCSLIMANFGPSDGANDHCKPHAYFLPPWQPFFLDFLRLV